jgi:hypothetical protein
MPCNDIINDNMGTHFLRHRALACFVVGDIIEDVGVEVVAVATNCRLDHSKAVYNTINKRVLKHGFIVTSVVSYGLS